MSLYTIIFYFFASLAALSAIGLVFSKNVFYGALLLLVCLLSVAGLYVLAWAEFIAIAQLLIYAGGVLVVILFGIMLTAKLGQKPLRIQHNNLIAGIFVSVSLAIMLICYLPGQPAASTPALAETGSGTVQTIGVNLMTDYVLPFEIAGILLLVALIGAAVIASHKTKNV